MLHTLLSQNNKAQESQAFAKRNCSFVPFVIETNIIISRTAWSEPTDVDSVRKK